MSKTEDFLKKELEDRAIDVFGKQGNLSNIENSNNLCGFFVEKMLKELGHQDASELFYEGYTDGRDDLGIDVLIRVANTVHVIQSKYRGFNSKGKRDDIDTFQSILDRLSNEAFEKHTNRRLKELLDEIDWMHDTFYFWFVTNLKIENQSEIATKTIINIPQLLKEKYKLDNDRINYEYIDQDKFYDYLAFKSVNDEKKQGIEKVELFAAKQAGKGRSSIIEIEENNFKSAIMVIESEQIAKWCRGENKTRLFDYNIRNYLGESKKNKRISETASNDPERFFLFNNGISAICESMTIDNDSNSIVAERFSVINGAQTVRTLEKISKNNTQPKVMIRVTEIPKHNDRNKFLKDVVRFNNTQNEIKTSDFRSNDNIQASMVKCFELITKGGKKCLYLPKRSEITNKNIIKIEMTEFARAIFNFKFNPYELVGVGSTILFDSNKPDSANSYYNQIFGNEESDMEIDDFYYKAGIYFSWVMLDKWLANEKAILRKSEDENSKSALDAIERKNIMMWFFDKFLTRLEKENNGIFSKKLFLRKIAQSKLDLNINSTDDKSIILLKTCFESIKEFAISEYRRMKDEKITNRQWIRGTGEISSKLEKRMEDIPYMTIKASQLI